MSIDYELLRSYRKMMRNSMTGHQTRPLFDHEFSDPFPVNEPRQVISFRSEMLHDVTALIRQARRTKGLLVEVVTVKPALLHNRNGGPPIEIPDRAVELVTNVSVKEFQEAIGKIADLHITLETMRPVPLSENDLGRDDNNVHIY